MENQIDNQAEELATKVRSGEKLPVAELLILLDALLSKAAKPTKS